MGSYSFLVVLYVSDELKNSSKSNKCNSRGIPPIVQKNEKNNNNKGG